MLDELGLFSRVFRRAQHLGQLLLQRGNLFLNRLDLRSAAGTLAELLELPVTLLRLTLIDVIFVSPGLLVVLTVANGKRAAR